MTPVLPRRRRQQQRWHLHLVLLLLLLLPLITQAGAPPGPETAYNDAGYIAVNEERRHVRA